MGTFDRLLVRPVSPLLHLVADEFALRRVGRMVQSLGVLVVALAIVDVDWNVLRVALVPITIVSGAVIFGSVWVMTQTLAFWTTEAGETASAFTYGGNQFTQYPLGVYGLWLRRLFGLVLPLAFVAYLPARYVLDRPEGLGVPAFVNFLSPVVAVASVLVASVLWRAGLRRYSSTGS
jgi:ABC-2 type transport system permease protein